MNKMSFSLKLFSCSALSGLFLIWFWLLQYEDLIAGSPSGTTIAVSLSQWPVYLGLFLTIAFIFLFFFFDKWVYRTIFLVLMIFVWLISQRSILFDTVHAKVYEAWAGILVQSLELGDVEFPYCVEKETWFIKLENGKGEVLKVHKGFSPWKLDGELVAKKMCTNVKF